MARPDAAVDQIADIDQQPFIFRQLRRLRVAARILGLKTVEGGVIGGAATSCPASISSIRCCRFWKIPSFAIVPSVRFPAQIRESQRG